MEIYRQFLESLKLIHDVTAKDIAILKEMINCNKILNAEEVAAINKDDAVFRSILSLYDEMGKKRQPNIILSFEYGEKLINNINRMDELIKLYNQYTLGPKLDAIKID